MSSFVSDSLLLSQNWGSERPLSPLSAKISIYPTPLPPLSVTVSICLTPPTPFDVSVLSAYSIRTSHWLNFFWSKIQCFWNFYQFVKMSLIKPIFLPFFKHLVINSPCLSVCTSGWHRIKMDFEERGWVGRIELDQGEGRGKTHKLWRVWNNKKKTAILSKEYFPSFWEVLHGVPISLIYHFHVYFIYWVYSTLRPWLD